MRRFVFGGVTAAVAIALSGCSWVSDVFGGDEPIGTEVSIFDVKPGDCFNPPAEVKAELANLVSVPCDTGHTLEAYARVDYVAPEGTTGRDYPGSDALTAFADKACQKEYQRYVGVIYQDSTLFYTFLLPSARGWDQGSDRTVVCLVTTTGKLLTASVKGTKL